jgi:hypothetical protein
MKEMDYYTVMGNRINYYQKKYDPENKFMPELIQEIPVDHPPREKKIQHKISTLFTYVLSMFF